MKLQNVTKYVAGVLVASIVLTGTVITPAFADVAAELFTTGDNQPTTGDNQPTTGDNQPTTGDNQPTTGDNQPNQPQQPNQPSETPGSGSISTPTMPSEDIAETPIKSDNTKTEVREDGTKVETKVEQTKDGSEKITVVETKIDGTCTESVKTTSMNDYGKKTVSTVVTYKDSNGKVTGITEKTIINVTKNAIATITISKNDVGKITTKATLVQSVKSDAKFNISAATLNQIKDTAGKNVIVLLTSKNVKTGKKTVIEVNTKKVVSGKKLYVSVYNKKIGKYIVDRKKVITVSKDGSVRIPSLKTGKYKLVTKK